MQMPLQASTQTILSGALGLGMGLFTEGISIAMESGNKIKQSAKIFQLRINKLEVGTEGGIPTARTTSGSTTLPILNNQFIVKKRMPAIYPTSTKTGVLPSLGPKTNLHTLWGRQLNESG
jgi:hypothetical protein